MQWTPRLRLGCIPDTTGAGSLILSLSRLAVMQATPPVQQKPMRMVAVLFASAGYALLIASGFSLLACSGGFLFSGLSVFFVVPVAAGVCAVMTLLTALFFRRRQRHFGWRTLLIEVSVLAFVAVGVLSWLDTRQNMRIFMTSSPVPSGLRIHHGRNILFNSYVHFTGPPSAIASLLQSKGLVEVPTEPPETSDVSGFSSRDRTKVSWSWWQPAAMSNPRFFFLHHKSEAVQGWSEGWWVNGATNEVYAFISG